MKVLVILGHQRLGSFCHAITEAAVEQLQADGHETTVHDLYQEAFDPILPDREIGRDAVVDAAIKEHCDQVMAADGYVVVHPNWWAGPPAIVKGWLDRVFRQGLTYSFGPSGVIGHLKDKKAVVITTSNTPRDVELQVYGDPLENFWKTCVFGFCGVEDFLRRNFESIVLSTPEERAGWLDETRRIMRQQFPVG
ncbi:MAG: NAD(P)H-dependent oxidoreductase [Thermoguttaceae bacterium]